MCLPHQHLGTFDYPYFSMRKPEHHTKRTWFQIVQRDHARVLRKSDYSKASVYFCGIWRTLIRFLLSAPHLMTSEESPSWYNWSWHRRLLALLHKPILVCCHFFCR